MSQLKHSLDDGGDHRCVVTYTDRYVAQGMMLQTSILHEVYNYGCSVTLTGFQ